jgi:hypothetical protein
MELSVAYFTETPIFTGLVLGKQAILVSLSNHLLPGPLHCYFQI